MVSDEFGETFRGLLLRHRGRSGLTQHELALRIGVHRNSLQVWETGLNYPTADRLQALIRALYDCGGLTRHRELEEVEALWDAALREAPRMRTPLDANWVIQLLSMGASDPQPDRTGDAAAVNPHHVWGDAPHVATFVGRVNELAQLEHWVGQARCGLVLVHGMGGVGKTSLAARLAEDIGPSFEGLYWCNLKDAPSVFEWVSSAIASLGGEQPPIGQDESAAVLVLLRLLRDRRCLLVMDNLDRLLEPKCSEIRYKPEHADFGRLIRLLAETPHRSCVILTSRELPDDLAPLSGDAGARFMELTGLSVTESQEVLVDRQLVGDTDAWIRLVRGLAGNVTALKIATETIRQVFGGNIAEFLDVTAECGPLGDLRRLLDSQIDRVSVPEHQLLVRFAEDGGPLTLAHLAQLANPGTPVSGIVQTVGTLRRRSLVHSSERAGAFALPAVIHEHMRHSSNPVSPTESRREPR